MKRFFLLGITLMVSVAMLMTACKKDEVKNNGNNNNTENPGGGGTAAEYVDLGLPSGTKWKSTNETGGNNGFYTYDEAVNAFEDKLPTKEQMEELIDNCTWVWQNNGYKVSSSNGNSIILPAAGFYNCEGAVYCVGSDGGYWSSTSIDSEKANSLYFYSNEKGVSSDFRCYGLSVRLVQK
ncbi:MAG: hypothetical protein J6P65_01050 [Bacteroidales bacterium]|nr:hypothetical protein [Bacteroidales bacterium]